MIATSLPTIARKWDSLSFTSTLYLCPVLDLLLREVPRPWQAELRLGLQEALVNAAKHGNNLDAAKTVSVRFSVGGNSCWWVIADQGKGCGPDACPTLPVETEEGGRGLYILHQVFDWVDWNQWGRELTLGKRLGRPGHRVLVS